MLDMAWVLCQLITMTSNRVLRQLRAMTRDCSSHSMYDNSRHLITMHRTKPWNVLHGCVWPPPCQYDKSHLTTPPTYCSLRRAHILVSLPVKILFARSFITNISVNKYFIFLDGKWWLEIQILSKLIENISKAIKDTWVIRTLLDLPWRFLWDRVDFMMAQLIL